MSKKIAFLFPGQGSQAVGMLDAFAEDTATSSLCTSLCQEADQELGQPISEVIKLGPADSLNLTVNTQPAVLLTNLVCYQAYLSLGGDLPDMVAGHSLGEYAAVVAAGGLTPAQAIGLVRIRAQAMQSAVPVGKGGMAAILGLTDEQVLEACAKASANGEVAEAVNFNAPSQVVAAGSAGGIAALCTIAKDMGAKRALPLPVSAPFHSSLLKPASVPLAEAISQRNLQPLCIKLVNNVDVAVKDSPSDVADALIRQAYSPVRWVESVQYMVNQGVTQFVECGPGKVLTGLVKRITDVPVVSISTPEQIRAFISEFQG